MAKAGCVYCDKKKDMSNNEYIDLNISNNSLSVSCTSIDYSMYLSSTKINYCPMCGRKLNGR